MCFTVSHGVCNVQHGKLMEIHWRKKTLSSSPFDLYIYLWSRDASPQRSVSSRGMQKALKSSRSVRPAGSTRSGFGEEEETTGTCTKRLGSNREYYIHVFLCSNWKDARNSLCDIRRIHCIRNNIFIYIIMHVCTYMRICTNINTCMTMNHEVFQ